MDVVDVAKLAASVRTIFASLFIFQADNDWAVEEIRSFHEFSMYSRQPERSKWKNCSFSQKQYTRSELNNFLFLTE